MYILSIESSCDESSVSILKNNKIIKCLTISQIEIFKNFGGVIPMMASDLHVQNLPILIKKIKEEFNDEFNKIKAVAYTEKPGLVSSLRIGYICAEVISIFKKIPIIPINHLHGHVYAVEINDKNKIIYPAIAMVISGGHTSTFFLKEKLSFETIGKTLDDAAGELLDKVARKLGLNYPGGPEIEKLSIGGKHKFKIPIYNNLKNLNYSFSGIKTHCINLINNSNFNEEEKRDFAFSLQETVFENIINKLKIAINKYKPKTLILSGGVSSNSFLRNKFNNIKNIKILIPEKKYCTDNAAMIGIVGIKKFLNKKEK